MIIVGTYYYYYYYYHYDLLVHAIDGAANYIFALEIIIIIIAVEIIIMASPVLFGTHVNAIVRAQHTAHTHGARTPCVKIVNIPELNLPI